MTKSFLFVITVCAAVTAAHFYAIHARSAYAQELVRDRVTTMKARVLEVTSEENRVVPGTHVESTYQTLRVEVLDGPEKGKIVTVENDYLDLEAGDRFYLAHTVNEAGGFDMYAVREPYRLPWLYAFTGVFVLCVLLFGGKQGLRGLIALVLSFFFIGYLLFPGILAGWSPVLVSMGVASLITVLGSYITHGFNRVTTSAVIGMVITILVTGAMAYMAIHGAKLSGFGSDEAVYLNLDTGGAIDFAGLLLGGILIGLLGVLYDAAIGQAVSVDELHRVGPHLSRRVIFGRAIRIGREHIGALVNTLAIAYVGASLPLLLLFQRSSADFNMMLNREIFAAEVLRTMIGSIGLVLAVPVTTLIAVVMLIGRDDAKDTELRTGVGDDDVRAIEERAIGKIGHIH